MSGLTIKQWETARRILHGGDARGCSVALAAKEAGVSTRVLKSFVQRSRERRVEDEPWVWEVAEDFDDSRQRQGEVLEDIAWNRVVDGTEEVRTLASGEQVTTTKHDNRLLEKLLTKRVEDYKEEVVINAIDAEKLGELHQRYLAQTGRLKAIEQAGKVLDDEATSALELSHNVVDTEFDLDDFDGDTQ